MNPTLKRILIWIGAALGAVIVLALGFALFQAHAYDASMEHVYDVPVPKIERSTDPAVLARGQHLAVAVAGCTGNDCHAKDLGGGTSMELGPLGVVSGPNITSAGIGSVYSDGELVRLIRHGVKKDGRSVRFMPAAEIGWLPESDLTALVSYIRTAPAVERPNGPVKVGLLGKVLDRVGLIALDVARKIDHEHVQTAPPPAPTAEYGKFLGRLCTGCHGDRLSGGPIPGAPPSLPTPLNLTPHETGMKDWTYDDFVHLLVDGVRKNGKRVDKFMPTESFGQMDDTEKRALWAYLRSVPPLPFGQR